MSVDHCRAHIAVTAEFLHSPDVVPILEEMGCEGMAEPSLPTCVRQLPPESLVKRASSDSMMDTNLGVNAPVREVEVMAKAQRRRFTLEYKRRTLQEADDCTKPGDLGALLRREGLYSSHLATWRQARARGELSGLAPKKRGPKAQPVDPNAKHILRLERENRRFRARAERAEALVELQKNGGAVWRRPVVERRRELMQAVREMSPRLGVSPTCNAMGQSRATYPFVQNRRL